MALDRLTKIDGGGISTTSDYRVGVITATKFAGPLDGTAGNFSGVITATNGIFSGNISAVDGTFSGNVSIAGTLTYEDVTNIDSVGIITGKGADINGDLDVDGHTNLDNVSIAGVATFADNKPAYFGTDGDFYINHSGSSLGMLNTTGNTLFRNTGGSQYFDCNQISLRIAAGSQTMLNAAPGGVTLYTSNSSKLATTNTGVSLPQDLDVDGHTNLDNLSVAGVSTFSDTIRVGSGVTIEPNGQATFVGVVTFGSGSTTIDNNVVNVGTALTLGHTQGLQFHTQNLHAQGFEVNQINASGIVTASSYRGDGSQLTGIVAGLSTISGVVNVANDLDVDGHTNLDNVSIAGVSTFSGVLDATNTPASIRVAQDIQHKGDADTKLNFHDADKFRIELGGVTSAFSGLKSTSGAPHAKWGINIATPEAALHINEAYNHRGVLRVTNGNQGTGYYHQLEMSGTQNIFTLWKHYDGSNYYNTHAHGSTGHRWYINGSEAVRVHSNGNVGIGTDTPTTGKLEIADSAQTNLLTLKRTSGNSGELSVQLGGSDPGVIFNTSGLSADFAFKPGGNEKLRITSGGELVFAGDTDTFIDHPNANQIEITAGNIEVATFIDGQSNRPAMLIDKGGVNNTTAGHNYNSNGNSNDLVVGNVSSGNHGITICSPSNAEGSLNYSDGSGGGADAYRGTVSFDHTNEKMIVRAKTGKVVLRNDATDTLVATGGKIGIGLDNPDQLLHIYESDGSSQAYVHVQNNRSRNAAIKFTTTQGSWLVGQGIGVDADRFSIYDTSERFVISNVGNCGVGQIAPAARLEVRDNQSNNYGTTIRLSQGYNSVFSEISSNFGGSMTLNAGEGGGSPIMHFQVNDDEKMKLDNSGNLTIGTSSWAYPKRLNVQGSSGHILSLLNADTTTYAANTMTGIELKLSTGNTGNQVASCEIRAFKENGTNGDSARALSFYTGVNGGSPNERLRITSRGDVCVDNMAYNTYDTAGTNINTMVDNNEKRSGVYWINYGGEIFRAYIKANWCEDRNWILAAKFFDMQDMPSGSSLWTNDTWVNESDFNLYGGIFSKYPAWRYFPFDRLAMQMGNRIPPIMRFSGNQTLYGAFSGGRASNGGGVTASSTYPAMSGTSVTYHSMSNFMGPDFYDVGGSEDRMQSYGLNKWANNSTQNASAQNRGSEHVHSGSRQDGGSLQYASLKGWGLTIEDSHPTINGIDSIAVAGAWIGCPLDEGNSVQGNNSSNVGADSGFGFGFCTGNPGRTGTAGYAEWGRGTECVNTLPAYIWLSAD